MYHESTGSATSCRIRIIMLEPKRVPPAGIGSIDTRVTRSPACRAIPFHDQLYTLKPAKKRELRRYTK